MEFEAEGSCPCYRWEDGDKPRMQWPKDEMEVNVGKGETMMTSRTKKSTWRWNSRILMSQFMMCLFVLGLSPAGVEKGFVISANEGPGPRGLSRSGKRFCYFCKWGTGAWLYRFLESVALLHGTGSVAALAHDDEAGRLLWRVLYQGYCVVPSRWSRVQLSVQGQASVLFPILFESAHSIKLALTARVGTAFQYIGFDFYFQTDLRKFLVCIMVTQTPRQNSDSFSDLRAPINDFSQCCVQTQSIHATVASVICEDLTGTARPSATGILCRHGSSVVLRRSGKARGKHNV